MRKPNFFILGAPKCGTTSLAVWLADHPNVFMSPIKEPNYFNLDAKKFIKYTQNEYEMLFNNADSQHIRVGEATTNYLFSYEAVPNILKYVDDPAEVRYIVAIRNPIDLSISLHGQRLREGRENVKDFASAWQLQKARAGGKLIPPLSDAGSLMYGVISRLGEQLERLLKVLNREQVHIILLSDVKENPRLEYLRVLDFLDLPDDGRESFPVYNEARSIPLWIAKLERGVIWFKGRYVIRKEFGFIKSLNRILFRSRGKEPVNVETRKELQDYFRDDIILLGEIINRDLSNWLDS